MKIKCPTCGSTDIVAEVKVPICFRISEKGNIEVVSEWNDVIKHIDDEVVYVCECEECAEVFEYDRAAKYRGGMSND